MAQQSTRRVLVLPMEGQPTVKDVAWDPDQDKQIEFAQKVEGFLGLSAEAFGATDVETVWKDEDEASDKHVELVMRDDRDMPVNQHVPHLTGTICVVGIVCCGEDDECCQYVDFDRYAHAAGQ